MQEISKRLHKQGLEKMKPLIQQLVAEGMDQNKIVGACKRYTDTKITDYYNKLKEPEHIAPALHRALNKLRGRTEDSKAEKVFYMLLLNNGINFDFQYRVGPYKIDYLVGGFLAVELDGPQHDKERDQFRDKYLRKHGYKVLRFSIPTLALDPEAVIREIITITQYQEL